MLTTRTLGRTDLAVTEVSVGASALGSSPAIYGYEVPADRARETLRRALAGPVNFLDTSNEYGWPTPAPRWSPHSCAEWSAPTSTSRALDLDHISVDGQVRWRNSFLGARLSEDDLAVAAILVEAARWGRGEGPAPYPLAGGLQDHMLALAVEDSARTRTTGGTRVEAWAG